MAQQQYWKWTDLHWYGLLMEISLEIKGANPADFFHPQNAAQIVCLMAVFHTL